jgi:DNA-binding SARP family transcriptional activator
MARLLLSVLGPLQVVQHGKPVAGFESDKVRALLAYLAVEADRPHRREMLIGLLWPHQPERIARHNLSQALYNLRRTIGDQSVMPPFLLVTPESIQFNRASDYRLDSATFTTLLSVVESHTHRQLEACHSCMDRIQRAVALYRGSFLEGFTLDGSVP